MDGGRRSADTLCPAITVPPEMSVFARVALDPLRSAEEAAKMARKLAKVGESR
jgi:hypothetical protein